MRNITALVVLLLVFSTPGFAADISGNWQLDMTNQMGQAESWTLAIKADGGELTIDAVHPMFGNVAGTGTMTGNKVTMQMAVAGGIGKVVVDFEGEVAGDKMEGTRKVSYDHSEDAGGEASGGSPGGAPGGGMPQDDGPGGPGGTGGSPGGAPEGGGPGGGMPGGPGGGAPEGGGPGGGAPAGGEISDAWTAVRK